MPALVPFIHDALSKDEQFIYIADDQTVDELAARLDLNGIDVGREVGSGALKLWTRREWRQPGKLSSEQKSRQVMDFIKNATSAGFKGVRFGVEMTWTLGPDIEVSDLEHWEASLNNIFIPGYPGRILCQYNRSRLSSEVMLVAFRTHPLVCLGESRLSQLVLRSSADPGRQLLCCQSALYDFNPGAKPRGPAGTQ